MRLPGWRATLVIAAVAVAGLTLLGGLPIVLSLILAGSATAAYLSRVRGSGYGGADGSDFGSGDDAGGDGGGGDGGGE